MDVTDSMEIAKRQLRNAIEHFDERLEDVHGEGFGLDIFDLNLMLFGASRPSFTPTSDDALRNFDGKGAYTFRGESFDLAKAREELESILERVGKFYEEEYPAAARTEQTP